MSVDDLFAAVSMGSVEIDLPPRLEVVDGCFVIHYNTTSTFTLSRDESRRHAQKLLRAQQAPRERKTVDGSFAPKPRQTACEARHAKGALARCKLRAPHDGKKHRSRDGFEWRDEPTAE